MDSEEGRNTTGDESENDPSQSVVLNHGIYLHSWRYFYPADEYPLFEASLPGAADMNENVGATVSWWPVEIKKNSCQNRD